jgi:Cyclophilin-like
MDARVKLAHDALAGLVQLQGGRMARIRFDFGALKLDAELLDTPTAKAIAAALPISSAVLTWGEEVYFDVPVDAAREPDARRDYAGRDRLLAARPGHRNRLWPHADFQRR